MNNYSSCIRTFTARNVLETVMPLPPLALSIAKTAWVPQIFETGLRTSGGVSQIIQESNIILRRLGLFCNFADGLIFNTPYANPVITISMYPYSLAIKTGTVTLASNSKSVTGVGTLFGTEIVVGDVINVNGILYRVATITNPSGAACATLTDYAHTCTTQAMYKVTTPTPPWTANFRWVNNLNYMYERDSFSAIALWAGNLTSYYIEATVSTSDNITFLTNTIETTFETKPVIFDVVADFEITAKAIT